MANAFQKTPDFRSYTNRPAQVPLEEKNPPNTALAERSERLDFSTSDLADDDELNDILWRAPSKERRRRRRFAAGSGNRIIHSVRRASTGSTCVARRAGR